MNFGGGRRQRFDEVDVEGHELLLSATVPIVDRVDKWWGRPGSCWVAKRECIGGGRIIE